MINTEKLKEAIQERLKGKSLKLAGNEAGIGKINLFNASLGKVPNLLVYESLCKWLNVPQSTFLDEKKWNS